MSKLDNRPALDDFKAWKIYWRARGQAWRTEPEIDVERQKYLVERRNIYPDIEKCIYPFKDIKLTRADVEWLLATLENKRGPILWSDPDHRRCEGLDLRGADLSGVDLKHLPLSCMRAGLADDEWNEATEEQRRWAAIHFERADLSYANLEGAKLTYAYLQEASLYTTHLEDADMYGVQLNGDFPVQLQFAFLNEGTKLEMAILWNKQHIGPRLADMHLDGADLKAIDWSNIRILGDEYVVYQKRTRDGRIVDHAWKLIRFRTAIRAYRQLSSIFHSQGMNEEADRFAYRAELLQRKLFWHRHEFGRWFFSMLLALLSGYGYRIWRILAAYVVVVSLFALAYFVLGMHFSPHLSLDQAFLESITAFHGRVFSEQFNPFTPQIWVTAFEAIAGLIIEGVFLAILVQRIFGK